MRLRTLHQITACLMVASAAGMAGCAPYSGSRTPIGFNQPGSPYYQNPQWGTVPVNNPGTRPPVVWSPWTPAPSYPTPGYPVPNPTTPQTPGIPVVLQPVPDQPGTNPNPIPGGNTTPTTPVSGPNTPPPSLPDVTTKWYPWPLPQFRAAVALKDSASHSIAPAQAEGDPHATAKFPEDAYAATDATDTGAESAPQSNELASTPAEDLRYRGGKTLPNLSYVNLYVGGESAGWNLNEVDQIESSLQAALTDTNLNHVIMQYFDNEPVGTTTLHAHPLVGYKPSIVSRGDIQHYVEHLADQGYLNTYDAKTTIFNFLLPPGTILTDKTQPQNAAFDPSQPSTSAETSGEDISSSTTGLGGYHGSVHYKSRTIYFSVGVYPERRSDGTIQGIPVFNEPWKNICATLYHQICEFRTDPDVEDALRDPTNPASEKFLGWASNSWEEMGDYALRAGVPLKNVFVEVPLANGQGVVPVQLMYSNAAHQPQGPAENPLPAAAR